MHTVDCGGATVHYRVEGSGPGLLLVHGTGADGDSNFGHLLEHFTGRTVIRPDYAGSGQTVAADAPLDLDALVEQVLGPVAAVTDEPVDVVGFSVGAVIAAAAAAACPGRVRRLVLVAGWARNDDPRQRLAIGLWRRLADLDQGAYARFLGLLLFSPGFLAGLGAEGVKEVVSGVACTPGTLRQIEFDLDVDIRDRLAGVVAPTLVVGCRHDQLIPVHHSRELHEAIAGSRYAEIDSGHLVVAERPGELVRAVQEFLASPT